MDNGYDSKSLLKIIEKCPVHFDDLDAFGMLYAGRYYPLVERGIIRGITKMGFPIGHEDMNVVIREMKLTFGAPIRRVGEVELEFWLARVSRSTATHEFVVRSEDGEHVRGYRTATKVNLATQRSAPWGDGILAAFGVKQLAAAV
ncbi:acyl-CoA thioesterase [Mycobacterium bourgelatii]|uniref:Thioesterase n=1 Tax=Mycobacterium bourgelatii TaxID=1273442 RepID=A0A7I9YL60_MYCBU|nr:thioesterase family protein [Mycobacterium bourgelatii]MCV6977997.1 hypothetical protein [Mycobacterium bourgelatii]GFG89411.1 thioesterase [Mycobacterium bourgelatii]